VTGEGPTHADDLQYLFKSLKEPQNWPDVKNGTEDEKFSKKMVKLWASFAIHGEPVASWGEPWTAAQAGPPGSVEHSWLSLNKEAKIVKDETILARINKLDYLYSEYELPPVSWRTKKDSPVKKDEL
jgi:carboxylesterase type B